MRTFNGLQIFTEQLTNSGQLDARYIVRSEVLGPEGQTDFGIQSAIKPLSVGGVIAGGTANVITGNFASVGGGTGNVADLYAFVGGGSNNRAIDKWSVIGGGAENTVGSYFGIIGGGCCNFLSIRPKTGPGSNNAPATYSSIINGANNSIDGNWSFIGGGLENSITGGGLLAFNNILGGWCNSIRDSEMSTILGGRMNLISGSGDPEESPDFIGVGCENKAYNNGNFIGGGFGNIACSNSTILNGSSNCAVGGTIVAGYLNKAIGFDSFVGNGTCNEVTASASFIGGGGENKISGSYAFIGEGQNNFISENSCLSFIGGGTNNITNYCYSFIGGGQSNTALAQFGFIGGGCYNYAGSSSSVVGGACNAAGGFHSIVGGGKCNASLGQYSSSVGGFENIAEGNYSFVGGGEYNLACADYSYIVGGRCSTVNANHSGAAILGDGQDRTHNSSGPHTLTLDFDSGVYVSEIKKGPKGFLTIGQDNGILEFSSDNFINLIRDGTTVLSTEDMSMFGWSIFNSNLNIINNDFYPPTGTIPSSNYPGLQGSIKFDKNYLYYCKENDKWTRTALAEW
jgi:hypothetical protein